MLQLEKKEQERLQLREKRKNASHATTAMDSTLEDDEMSTSGFPKDANEFWNFFQKLYQRT